MRWRLQFVICVANINLPVIESMKKIYIYIAAGFLVLATIGAIVEEKPVNIPAELVGSYELKNRTPEPTIIQKLTFETTGNFQYELHLISHNPLLGNAPDNDPITH